MRVLLIVFCHLFCYCTVLTVGVPEITELPADVEVMEGDALRLSCATSASLRPFTTVWWLHNAVPVMSSEFTHITGKYLMYGLRTWMTECLMC